MDHLLPCLRFCLNLLLPLMIVATAQSACSGPLADAFFGSATFVEDATFQPPTSCRFHAEYSTAHFNGQYYMYFRTFRNPDGSYGEIAGIGLATSSDGDAWTAHNGGRAVLPKRQYTDSTGTHDVSIYAPSVIAETVGGVPRLVMVYEIMDTGVTSGQARPRHWVEAATSTDGIAWQPLTDGSGNNRKILLSNTAWEGYINSKHHGNVGTPSLHKFGSTYYVAYHGFGGTDGPDSLKRGLASGLSLENLSRSPANPILSQPGRWADVGVGRGDIVIEDGYYYMIFEALRYSALCGPALTGWGLARSTDLATWEYSPRNPVRIDRVAGGCGEDMPSFQVIGSNIYVVTTTSDLAEIPSVRRYKIAPVPREIARSEITAMAGTTSGDGYWQLTRTGRVLAWGAADALGSTSDTQSASAVDIVANPAGGGYWVALSNGAVRPFGTAVSFGSMEGASLAGPVSGMAPTPDGKGYWLVAEDGGIFTFGNAPFHGSQGGSPLSSPVIDMAARPAGDGYWLLGADGQVYRFGDAADHDSVISWPFPATEIQSTATGNGYWIITEDGNVHRFGDAVSIGSTGGMAPSPVVGAALRQSGSSVTGCWLTAEDGGIVEFGTALFHGDPMYSPGGFADAGDWALFE